MLNHRRTEREPQEEPNGILGREYQGSNKGCKYRWSSPIEVKCVGERGQETKQTQLHTEIDVCSCSCEG